MISHWLKKLGVLIMPREEGGVTTAAFNITTKYLKLESRISLTCPPIRVTFGNCIPDD